AAASTPGTDFAANALPAGNHDRRWPVLSSRPDRGHVKWCLRFMEDKLMATACSTSVGTRSTLAETLGKIAGIGMTHVDLLAIDGWVHIHTQALVDHFEETVAPVDALLAQYNLRPLALNTGVSP